MYDFTDKVVVVTGASGIGIGNQIARDFLAAGAKVAICSRKADSILEAKKQMDPNNTGRVFASVADMRSLQNIREFIKKTADTFGQIDVLVNNAGVAIHGPTEQVSEEDYIYIMDTKLKGYFFMAQAAAVEMERQKTGGSIINIGSVNGIICNLGSCVYAMANAGVTQMTRSLAREWGHKGIRVNCVGPGSIPTLMNKEKYSDPAVELKFCETLPLRRRGKTSEISDAVLFFASDSSAYITGQTLYVDGGLVVNYG